MAMVAAVTAHDDGGMSTGAAAMKLLQSLLSRHRLVQSESETADPVDNGGHADDGGANGVMGRTTRRHAKQSFFSILST